MLTFIAVVMSPVQITLDFISVLSAVATAKLIGH